MLHPELSKELRNSSRYCHWLNNSVYMNQQSRFFFCEDIASFIFRSNMSSLSNQSLFFSKSSITACRPEKRWLFTETFFQWMKLIAFIIKHSIHYQLSFSWLETQFLRFTWLVSVVAICLPAIRNTNWTLCNSVELHSRQKYFQWPACLILW